MATKYPLILVDASGYLFRAYHALPKLTNSRGEATGAVVGVLNMLRKLIDEYQPQYIGVVFDAAGRSFRNDLYAEYKAHRPPMPEDLREQIEPLQAVIRALGLPLLVIPDVEADDVIGTLATQAAAQGLPTLISTGDKDMAQLVDAHVTLVNTMTDTLLDPDGVREKFGVPPERIVDYLSLMGDSVDNVPGVPKCGPKTAVKWIQEFGDLDGVIANADAIKGKVGECLRAALDQLPLARELTTIKRDVALALGPTDLRPTAPDLETLRTWYERIESRRLLATLDEPIEGASSATDPQPQPAEADYELVLTQEALETWMRRLESAELFAFDTETTDLDYMRAEIVGVSFAVEPGQAAYVPVAHVYPGAPDQLDRDAVLARLKPLLEDPDARQGRAESQIRHERARPLRHRTARRRPRHHAGKLCARQHRDPARHGLARQEISGLRHRPFRGRRGQGGQTAHLRSGPARTGRTLRRRGRGHHPASAPGLLAPAGGSPLACRALSHHRDAAGRHPLAHRAAPACASTAACSPSRASELSKRLAELENQAYETAGHRFNMGSPKQIGAIFFEELGLPVIAKTPKGAPSTSEEVLEQLAAQGHALPDIILQHRGLAKLKSTYTDKLPQMVNPETGRVHTSYHQAVAATGRLSSSDPNLQNIPIRTEEGRRIRRAFIAEPGHRLLAADYSQIELRIMAHLSGDERLLAAFASGLDIHRATAAEILGLAPEEVTGDQRRSAKAINFGLIYGMSAFGLARQLGIERGAAQEYVDRYFQRYPGVKEFMERTRVQARADGYVETLFGRRLYLPEIANSNQNRRAAAERTAINAPMQGTAADIIKRAMIAVDQWLLSERPPVRMIMQVHDELVFEVAEDAIAMASGRIRAAMESAAELAVPLLVEIGDGENWDAAH